MARSSLAGAFGLFEASVFVIVSEVVQSSGSGLIVVSVCECEGLHDQVSLHSTSGADQLWSAAYTCLPAMIRPV